MLSQKQTTAPLHSIWDSDQILEFQEVRVACETWQPYRLILSQQPTPASNGRHLRKKVMEVGCIFKVVVLASHANMTSECGAEFDQSFKRRKILKLTGITHTRKSGHAAASFTT